jgi:transcriptional regulator with XRE-family HTH domain
MSKFAIRFASEYKGFMKSAGISGAQLAEKLGRGEGYVSERINGKRAIDTNDIDALARLAEGWDGRSLMIELARRVRYNVENKTNNVTELRPNVSRSTETVDLKTVDLRGFDAAADERDDRTPTDDDAGK